MQKLRQLKLNGKQEEGDCRQFYLPTDKNQAKIGVLLVTIPILCFIFNDFQLLTVPWQLWGIVALRVGLSVLSLVIFWYLGKIGNYRSYDKIITLWAIVMMVGGAIINMTRPQNFIAQVILSCISVFIFYLVIPNRFQNQFMLSTITSVGEALIVVVVLRATDTSTLFSVFTSLFFANVVAIISSWQLHVYRQKSYQDYIKSKDLQDKLEQHTKHLEELVTERTEKLKAAERLAAIGATAGMVGHDIRNPLTSITGAVYLAKKELRKMPDSESKEKLEKNIDLIADQTLYVNKIVADLQDYAQPLQPNLEKVNLKNLAQAIVKELKIGDPVTVSYMIDEKAATLKTDSAYMKRILTNLINNAVQAMPNGGKLTIQATSENSKATLTVEDTGEGIPPENKDKLFTPLFTTKSRGRGFGLAVVKRLTEGLGGTVTFESQEGKGTKFIIELPAAK
jgi:signal transduction histidine kinase